jgi:hypothetical protein
MIKSDTAIGRFFEVFARESNGDNIPAMVSQFADPFLSAGPQGVQCIRATEFTAALPKRRELFNRLGARPASLVSLEETQLDVRYVLAKTRWKMEFAREDLAITELLLDSTFLVDAGTEVFKILMYMPHQDIMQVLKERGILKAQ